VKVTAHAVEGPGGSWLRSVRPPSRVALTCALGVALALTTLVPVGRADIPGTLRGAPVREVVVEGEASGYVDPATFNVRPGAPLTRDLIRGLILKATDGEEWLDAIVEAEEVPAGVRLHVTLVPRIVALRVDLRGNAAIPRDEILRTADVGEGARVDPVKLERGEDALRKAYAQAGYEAADVRISLRDSNVPAKKVVLIEVKEGPATRVLRVRFRGDTPKVGTAVAKDFADLIGSVFSEQRVAEELAEIGTRLRREQFLEARVAPVPRDPSTPPGELTVDLRIGPKYRLDIRGAAPLAPSEVASALALEAEPLVAASMEGGRDRILELYRRLGYRHAQVSVERTGAAGPQTKTQDAVLAVRIDRGLQEEVVRVAFPGARHFEDSFLEGQINSYLDEELPGSTFVRPVDTPVADVSGAGGKRTFERDAPRPASTDPRRVYYEAVYEEAIEHIRELYQSEGFMDAKVGPAALIPVDATRRVVSIPVVEGPRTFLESVDIRGEEAQMPRDLLTASRLKRGMPFSNVALEQARIAILDYYRERGYYYARVEARTAFSGDRTRAGVAFEIFEGYEVVVGRHLRPWRRGHGRGPHPLTPHPRTRGPPPAERREPKPAAAARPGGVFQREHRPRGRRTPRAHQAPHRHRHRAARSVPRSDPGVLHR
jgi:outer membrane protein insertion porin family